MKNVFKSSAAKFMLSLSLAGLAVEGTSYAVFAHHQKPTLVNLWKMIDKDKTGSDHSGLDQMANHDANLELAEDAVYPLLSFGVYLPSALFIGSCAGETYDNRKRKKADLLKSATPS